MFARVHPSVLLSQRSCLMLADCTCCIVEVWLTQALGYFSLAQIRETVSLMLPHGPSSFSKSARSSTAHQCLELPGAEGWFVRLAPVLFPTADSHPDKGPTSPS